MDVPRTGRPSPAFVVAVGVVPAVAAAGSLLAGDVLTDGGWGTASGLVELVGYAGFPAAAAVLAGTTGLLAGRGLAESAFWSLAALPSYVAWWILAVTAYAVSSTQFLGLH